METYITVQGNLTADPDPRTTANGATLVRLRVASNPRRFDRESGGFKDGDPMYIGVSCWRGLAANVLASLRKGDSVVVLGKLLFREYDDTNGAKQRVHEIEAVAVGPDLNRWAVDLRRPQRQDVEAAVDVPEPAEAAEPATAAA
ncbi:MAG TPA: single-stranded DNA-binding protein [Mycobacteriales bacterium]|nr:single-stranded DNA-binding protein [Mycobacteriales bacterium]